MTHDPELERRVDRALKQLPAPSAPPALLSNIMRAIENDAAAAAPAVARLPPAAEWPVAMRIAFSAMGAAIVVAALLLWPLALDAARSIWYAPLVVLLRSAVSTARPMVPMALIYLTAMCVVCATAASMLKHVALGGASNS